MAWEKSLEAPHLWEGVVTPNKRIAIIVDYTGFDTAKTLKIFETEH